MTLERLGWNDRFERHFETFKFQGLHPARVLREDRGRYRVGVGAEPGGSPAGGTEGDVVECAAELSGRFRHEARDRMSFPAVGDWVAGHLASGLFTIAALLPRSSVFVRRAVGDATEPQVVAANIDTVFVIAGLDGDYNPRRIERYVTAAWESGAQPVVLLNKSDLGNDIDARLAETGLAAPAVPVVAISARDGLGLDALAPWLTPGSTVALLGMSGVGKSTLINTLLGEERLATREVRAWDSRGMHTTTHRELVLLPSGAILIDTPGMRVLKLWSGESALDTTFPDIEALARGCRFGDCAHATEPACAVVAAAESGALEPERLESWRKLQRELRFIAGKQDQRIRQQELSRWKAIHKSMKSHPKTRARRES